MMHLWSFRTPIEALFPELAQAGKNRHNRHRQSKALRLAIEKFDLVEIGDLLRIGESGLRSTAGVGKASAQTIWSLVLQGLSTDFYDGEKCRNWRSFKTVPENRELVIVAFEEGDYGTHEFKSWFSYGVWNAPKRRLEIEHSYPSDKAEAVGWMRLDGYTYRWAIKMRERKDIRPISLSVASMPQG